MSEHNEEPDQFDGITVVDPTGKRLTLSQTVALKHRKRQTREKNIACDPNDSGYLDRETASAKNRVYENTLTRENGHLVRRELVKGIETGMPRRLACARAGIDYATLKRWLQIARGVKKQLEAIGVTECTSIAGALRKYFTPAESACFSLMYDIRKAEGNCAHMSSLAVMTAQQKSWQAAAWWLERRHSKYYKQRSVVEGQQVAVQVNTDSSGIFGETVSKMTLEQKKLLLSTFEQMGAAAFEQNQPAAG